MIEAINENLKVSHATCDKLFRFSQSVKDLNQTNEVEKNLDMVNFSYLLKDCL